MPVSSASRAEARTGSPGPAPLYDVREIKPQVFVWVPDDILDQESDPQFSRAGTAGFVLMPDGVAVVNATDSPFHARELLYEIRQRTDAPIKYLIDTDADGEHILGNEVFADEQAVIISSEAIQAAVRRYSQELAERLRGDWRLEKRMRGFHPTPPTRTFRHEMTVDRAGDNQAGSNGGPAAPGGVGPNAVRELKLIEFSGGSGTASGASISATATTSAGPAPAPEENQTRILELPPLAPTASAAPVRPRLSINDIAVYVPASKVLFMGDLFQNTYYPRFGPTPEPRDVRRWVEILRQVESWDVDVYVPGHGPPGGKREVAEFRRFLEWLSNEVETRIKEGKTLEQVEQDLKLPLSSYHWHAPELTARAVEAVYEQLPKPQRANGSPPQGKS